jgi:hypothetical protein
LSEYLAAKENGKLATPFSNAASEITLRVKNGPADTNLNNGIIKNDDACQQTCSGP